ncbi:hypothetical protein [Sphingobacterium faecale]|uniref:SMI1/KNR4 family protein n=1 Tax=Sphingobacterium faecale TaxID=2803775 RepID=A0ABS1R5H2_9SPHI|nr:hypothetical protein [Sphingobacterium faecale]MBL1409908.1 hypothetical protein [Sphingobacterium faecale]
MLQDYLHLFPNHNEKTVPTVRLSEQFLGRYPKLPREYADFVESFSLLSNKSDTTWFNSAGDFNGKEEGGFRWDEFEQQSLVAFDGDTVGQEQVRDFWNHHIPIVLSVKNGYSHFSMGVGDHNLGKIYFGEEPDYEEVEWVADSFLAFMEALKTGQLAEKYQYLFA